MLKTTLRGAKGVDDKLNRFLAIIIAVIIAVSACFALGAFDGDGVVRVDNKDFAEFTFSGDLKGGLFDGYGSVHFPGGERFSGNFAGGRFDGTGAFFGARDEWSFSGVFQSGSISGGTLNMDSGGAVTLERSEAAVMLVSEVWLFDGSFDDRGQTGDGAFVFADGSEYVGGFLNGLADGEGIFKGHTGRIIYQGGFKEGFFDGQGNYFSLGGWSYNGGFSGGVFHGEGVIDMGGETVRGVWDLGVQIARYE